MATLPRYTFRSSAQPKDTEHIDPPLVLEDQVHHHALAMVAEHPLAHRPSGLGQVVGRTIPGSQLKDAKYLGIAGESLIGQRGDLVEGVAVGLDAVQLQAQPLPEQRLHLV